MAASLGGRSVGKGTNAAALGRRTWGGRSPAVGGLAVRALSSRPWPAGTDAPSGASAAGVRGATEGGGEGDSAAPPPDFLVDSTAGGPAGRGAATGATGSRLGGDTTEGENRKSQTAAAAHTASPPQIAQRAKGRRSAWVGEWTVVSVGTRARLRSRSAFFSASRM